MNRLTKLIVSSVVSVTLAGATLLAASPATAATQVTEWIAQSTQSVCNSVMEGRVRAASYSGYTNIQSSGSCYYVSSRGVWEGWVSYTRP